MRKIRIVILLTSLIWINLPAQSQHKSHPLDSLNFPLSESQRQLLLEYAGQYDPQLSDFLNQKIINGENQDSIFFELSGIASDYLNSLPEASGNIARAIITVAQSLQDSANLVRGYLQLAKYQTNKGDYQASVANDLKAMEIAKKIQNNKLYKAGLNGISTTHYYMHDYQKSIDYLAEYIRISEATNDQEGLTRAYLNISNPYYDLGELALSERYLQKALVMARDLKDAGLEAYCLGNLADLYIDLGKIPEAIEMQSQGIALEEADGDKLAMIDSHGVLSECYAHLKNPKMAEAHLSQSLALCNELGTRSKTLEVYKESISIYKELGDADRALEYAQLFINLYDSLLRADRNDQIAEMREKYETAQKESQIKELEEARKISELEINQRRNQNIILAVTLLLLLVIILSILFFYFQSTRQKHTLQEQNNVIKAVNKQLEVSQQELSAANQTKDKFFALVAHDLRGPITAMQGVGDVLNFYMSKGDTSRVNQLIGQLDQSALSVNQLLDNLLKWAMSQSDGIQFHPEPISIIELINQCNLLFRESLQAKNLTLESHFQTQKLINADCNMLSTVIRNLLNNAIKFTPAGGLISWTVNASEMLSIQIKDSGIGMSKEQLDRLFGLSKATTMGTAGEKGTGLGLMLCHDFVKRHGGTMSVQSKPGEGSTFEICLPLN